MKTGIRVVYNRLLHGWLVVRGPHQAPISGKFDTKAEVMAWLKARRDPDPYGIHEERRRHP
jgi:hypothetical protein